MSYGLVDLGGDLLKKGEDAWKWASTPENMQSIGKLLGGVGQAYGAYEQSKYAKNLLKLQKAQYLRGIKKEDKAQKNLQQGFANSGLVRLA